LFLPQIPPRPHHGRADKRPRRLSAKGTQSPTATGRAHRRCHCTLSGERAQFQSPCALTAAPKLQKRPPQPKPSSKECVDPPISSGGETCATCAHATATRCRAHRLRSRTWCTCPRLQFMAVSHLAPVSSRDLVLAQDRCQCHRRTKPQGN
jgi:hypothetical protein